jgi:hypothetical protein
MRGRRLRVAGHGKPWARRRRAWRVGWALGVSLAAHLVLAWPFLSSKAPLPALLAPLPEVVEIDFEVPQVVVAIPASAETATGMPSHAAPGTLASRAKNAVSHQDALGAAPGDADGSAQGAAVQVPSAPSRNAPSLIIDWSTHAAHRPHTNQAPSHS